MTCATLHLKFTRLSATNLEKNQIFILRYGDRGSRRNVIARIFTRTDFFVKGGIGLFKF